MQKAITILVIIVGVLIVAGAVLHSVLFPEIGVPTWLVTAVATVVGYLFGIKKEATLGAFKLGKKK